MLTSRARFVANVRSHAFEAALQNREKAPGGPALIDPRVFGTRSLFRPRTTTR
jgi:hypothetical protein